MIKFKAIFLCFCLVFIICLINMPAFSLNNVKKAEELMVLEKQIEVEKEKAIIEQFYSEGEHFSEIGDYGAAIEQFSRVLEIDPAHKGAKKGIKKVKKQMKKLKRARSPKLTARRLLRSGRAKYAAKDYDGAIADFQGALALDGSDKDIFEWLKRTRRRRKLEQSEEEERDAQKDIELAEQQKSVQEKMAMLDVEKAYQPPKKPERRPMEIEEIISPEDELAERTRKELLRKLQEKMVPAVSLAEADIRDVIRQLMEITGVTIVIDEGALAEASGKDPLRITFSTVNPLPLLEVLDIALRATDLSYRVEPNYIWISTPEKLEKENMVTKTYRLKYGVRRIRKVELKEFETKSNVSE